MTKNDFNPVQTTPFSLKTKIRIYLWSKISRYS